jgi:hypothetical protein
LIHKSKIIDTLALSWYLYPNRNKHGLEKWGEYFGTPKPEIIDWDNPDLLDEYIHRCQEDVKINCQLWDKQKKDLELLYGDQDYHRLINYLMFKMDCAREAERSRWKLDVDRCKRAIAELTLKEEDQMETLKSIMPEVIKTSFMERPESLYKKGKIMRKPKVYKKKSGELSASGLKYAQACESRGLNPDKVSEVNIPSRELTSRGKRWVELLEINNLPDAHKDPIEYEVSRKDPNPKGSAQRKDLLFSLGWEPATFSYVDDRKIPQIMTDVGGEKHLCPSVKKLFKVEPKLEALEGLSVLGHRIGILKGFLENVDEDGYIMAQIQGFTNTLRFKHKVVVNLPSIKKPYGDIVRGCLIAPEGCELVGSDMASLEDRTKQHFMWEFDPDYVKEMQTEDFDPHLNLAEFAGALTPEQVQEHKNGTVDHGVVRHLYKTANYSCTYGAGGKKLALTLDIPEKEGHEIVDAYRDKNWAIEAIAQDQLVKFFYRLGDGSLTYRIYKGKYLLPSKDDTVGEKKSKYSLVTKAESLWLLNPVNRFWYSLRYPKDIFSTLNQGTGTYCFDVWVGNFRRKRPQLTGQMHDEVILCKEKDLDRDIFVRLLKHAVQRANKQLKLNRKLDVDIQFGSTYADIH